MSSVVKTKKLKVKTTLDIVPPKQIVDVIDTGTTTYCFFKEGNVDNISNVDIGINVMSLNGGIAQSIVTAEVKHPPTFPKKHVTPTFFRPWNQAPSTLLGNYATTTSTRTFATSQKMVS